MLNVDGFEAIVRKDIEYLLELGTRAGGDPSYPAPFFLLKLLRFSPTASESEVQRAMSQVVDDWRNDTAWSDRTSMTSMGLALVADLPNAPQAMIHRAEEYLRKRFGTQVDGRSGWSTNLIDDAYTVYNLFERYADIVDYVDADLFLQASQCADGLAKALSSEPLILSPPPYGGSVDSPEFATAVVVRALIAFRYAKGDEAEQDILRALINSPVMQGLGTSSHARSDYQPFWGSIETTREQFAFVLMPFTEKRTQIYERYVKRPLLESLGLICVRADDIMSSSDVMMDVWEHINRCAIIIADMSDRNPNVFYELGLAHVVGKPIVLLAETEGDIPFDLRAIRHIIYGDLPGKWELLADRVTRFVADGLSRRR
jgi:hypothetical protein